MNKETKIANTNIMSKQDEANVILMRCSKRNQLRDSLIKISKELSKGTEKDIKKVRKYIETGRVDDSTGKTVDNVVGKIESEFSDELNKLLYNANLRLK